MIGVTHILVPTDFSKLSRHAGAHALALARAHSARITVVHVNEPVFAGVPASEIGVGVVAMSVDDESIRGQLDAYVREVFAGAQPPPAAEVLHGATATALTDFARDRGVDLIVIGTHARGLVNRILLGSVSKSVLEHAHCPVLMVPLRCADAGGAAQH